MYFGGEFFNPSVLVLAASAISESSPVPLGFRDLGRKAQRATCFAISLKWKNHSRVEEAVRASLRAQCVSYVILCHLLLGFTGDCFLEIAVKREANPLWISLFSCEPDCKDFMTLI